MVSEGVQEQTIDWLRFFLACLVVLLHAGADGIQSSYPVYRTLCLLTTKGICQIAVPCFFFISGYLFFNHLEKWRFDIWRGKMSRRVSTLLIPYVLWNLIAIVSFILYSYLRTNIGSLDSPIKIDYHNLAVQLKDWFLGDKNSKMPIDYPLWFVRDLIVITILTPLIYLFCRYLRWYGVAVLAILVFIIPDLPKGVWFYIFGATLSIGGTSLVDLCSRIKWPATVIFLLLLCFLPVSYKSNPVRYHQLLFFFTIVGCIFAFAFSSMGIRNGLLHTHPFLTKSAFFIFASHGILILDDFSRYILLHITQYRGELYYCCNLFIRPLIAISFCLALFYCMNRWMPAITRVLIGAR